MYRETVELQSPGSRSAPWVAIHHAPFTPQALHKFVTNRFYDDHRSDPRANSS
jgi:hypothetical protein